MKVMCIDASKGKGIGCMPPFKERDVLTAKQSPRFKDSYTLKEHPFCACGICGGTKKSWLKSRFIPLSDIDETQTKTYKQLQTQTV